MWLLCAMCVPIAVISRQTKGKSHGHARVCSREMFGGPPTWVVFWGVTSVPCSIQGWKCTVLRAEWASTGWGEGLVREFVLKAHSKGNSDPIVTLQPQGFRNSWLQCSFTLPLPASSMGFFPPGEAGIPYPHRPAFPLAAGQGCGTMQRWQVASPGGFPRWLPQDPALCWSPWAQASQSVRENPTSPVLGVMLTQQPYAGLPETVAIFKGVGITK